MISIFTCINRLSTRNTFGFGKGKIDPDSPITVRVHSECLTGDVFGSKGVTVDQLDSYGTYFE